MTELTIPEVYAPGLAQIITLPDEAIDSLCSALDKTSEPVKVKSLASDISEQISVPKADLRNIIRTLISLYSLQSAQDASPQELAKDIARAAQRSGRPELVIADMDRLAGRLVRLLGFTGLRIASKAIALENDYEHSLCRARILTDARPVYSDDPTAPPIAAVIVHTLKLAYHEGAEVKELYLAMNAGHLSHLKAVIERAEAKAKGLESVLESGKLRVVSE